MDAANTDRLIARAISAIPYRKAPAGFGDKIMAEISSVRPPVPFAERVLEAAALVASVWAAALGFAAARFIYSELADIAAFFAQPESFLRAIRLLAAHAALAAAKLAETAAFAYRLLSAAGGLPAWYEAAVSALLCSAVIVSLSCGRQPGRQAEI